jgi:hypothetical protein
VAHAPALTDSVTLYLSDPRYGVSRDVYIAYRQLKWRSEGARYLMAQFTATEVRRDILDRYLSNRW